MSRNKVPLVLASALLLASIVAGVLVLLRHEAPKATEAAAMLAAKRAAVTFFTLDPDNVEDQADAVLELATGTFRREYADARVQLIGQVRAKERRVSAVVPDGGTAIASFDEKEAVVLVAVDKTEREKAGKPTTSNLRIRVTVNRIDEVWKTSTLDELQAVPGPGEYRAGALPGGGTTVVQAAADGISRLLANDYRRLDEDLEETLPLLTGTFAISFARTFDTAVRPVAAKKKQVNVAYVRAAGVVVRDGEKVRCLVFVDQVLDPDGDAVPTPARLFVDLERVAGTWLLADVTRA